MSMSKKDYQAIARAIHEARGLTATAEKLDPGSGINRVAHLLADVLAAENPRFDRARFVEACETGRCKGMAR